jgi:hypothetical protein
VDSVPLHACVDVLLVGPLVYSGGRADYTHSDRRITPNANRPARCLPTMCWGKAVYFRHFRSLVISSVCANAQHRVPDSNARATSSESTDSMRQLPSMETASQLMPVTLA